MLTVLIVEDGNEYLENLSRFVEGPEWVQVHNGADALARLRQGGIDLVYLDMRFDRIPLADLLGDHAAATRQHNGDPARAWRYLQNNQGLFILNHLGANGFAKVPCILSYDFSREARRFDFLQQQYPNIGWVSDAVTPDEIRRLMEQLTGRPSGDGTGGTR
jgi:CheY-like chemotaxis protein